MPQSKKLEKLIVVLGPTASGKTELALKLAKKFNGEIISADSRTFYQGMDIGTAKPEINKFTPPTDKQLTKIFAKNRPASGGKNNRPKEKNKERWKTPIIISGIPHYMINIIKANQEFTVTNFKQKTIEIIKDIHLRNKLPFLVGGAGLYISAVVDNLNIPEVHPDKKIRNKLNNLLKKHGVKFLWQKLISLDPEAKKFVDQKNPRRIIRALEVCLKTKKLFSDLRKRGKRLFKTCQIGINVPKEKLYLKINQRVEQMIKKGLIKETKNLIKKYPDVPSSLKTIGYQETALFLQKKLSLIETAELIKKNTRHYAKRQLTWFSSHKEIKWIKTQPQAEKIIKKFLSLSSPSIN